MIQIENTLVSFDIFEKKFSCDLRQCKGVCCGRRFGSSFGERGIP